jgi:hypothetical protein
MELVFLARFVLDVEQITDITIGRVGSRFFAGICFVVSFSFIKGLKITDNLIGMDNFERELLSCESPGGRLENRGECGLGTSFDRRYAEMGASREESLIYVFEGVLGFMAGLPADEDTNSIEVQRGRF